MQKPKYSFHKSERIVHKKAIEYLYQKGSSLFVYPLKVRFTIIETHISDVFTKVLISVPKKNFKKAVHRNRIKRLIREAYRLNKHTLEPISDTQINIHFHYISRTILPFEEIQNSIEQILMQIQNQLKNDL